jgi:hypothetical protein
LGGSVGYPIRQLFVLVEGAYFSTGLKVNIFTSELYPDHFPIFSIWRWRKASELPVVRYAYLCRRARPVSRRIAALDRQSVDSSGARPRL